MTSRNESKTKLEIFKTWLEKYLIEVLGDLLNLTKTEFKNQYARALIFQLFENNGVVKREDINHLVKNIPQDFRRKLWNIGVKIGRYHVYLPKMLKPKAVLFRVSLWELYQGSQNKHEIPKSGLNFINNRNFDKKFMLLCGFENFHEYFVRIDILEKLFIKIIEKKEEKKFKIN